MAGSRNDRDKQVRPQTIAVTGASGFVGGYVLGELQRIAQEHPLKIVRLLDQSGDSRADIRDATAVEQQVAAVAPTAVIHLAAIAAPAQASSDPVAAWEINLMGTLNLARAVLQHVPDAWFVFAGSSEVYGSSFNRGSDPVTEETPLRPVNPYGATKAAADIMLGQMAHQGLKAIRFRPFNHTGPGQAPIYVASDFARQIAMIEAGKQRPTISVGNLSAQRDFVDVRDIARAYIRAALGEGQLPPGCAINLSTGRPWKIHDLLQSLIGLSSSEISVEVDPRRLRTDDIPCASGNHSRATNLLNWEPEHEFRTSLAMLLDHWRAEVASVQQDKDMMRL